MRELTNDELRKRQDFLFVTQTTYMAVAVKLFGRRGYMDLLAEITSAAVAIPIEMIPDDMDEIVDFVYALGYYIDSKQRGPKPSKRFPELIEWIRTKRSR